ncbi:MAG: rhodanese-like domain-containing protein [Gammaproteobacteria bacterium]|nr:rhodanese-like domain-containing protein [Gammaproteobacteria bacterium]
MFIEFFVEYWYLFAMLGVIIVLLAIDPSNRGVAGAKRVSALQLPQVQSRTSAIVVDIREAEAFKNGHISQSINLPISTFENSMGKLKKYKDKGVILACEAGNQTGKAAAILRKNEYTEVYVLTGGLAAWRKENLPLEKK